MSDTQAFLECIEAVYDAGTDVERWPHALAALSDLINGQMGSGVRPWGRTGRELGN